MSEDTLAPARRRSRIIGAGRRLYALAAAQAQADRDRWPLFAPVGFGAGIGLYFALPFEPWLWPLLAALVAGVAVAVVGRRRQRQRERGMVLAAIGTSLALMAAGASVAKVRTLAVAAPILAEQVGPREIAGRIARVEDLAEGQRILLDHPVIPGLAVEATPERVRVKVRERDPDLTAGQWAAVTAILMPPPAPAAPGAFDFGRDAFFDRVGAVGFALGDVRPADAAAAAGIRSASRAERAWHALARARQHVTVRVRQGVGGAAGAMAAALMTGEQGAIPPDVLQAMRDSGLAHLLSVSGLHFGLVSGILYFAFRAALALIPPLALRFPVKKWAAVAALAGAAGYLAITGGAPPTQRSFVMVSLACIAVLVDRTAISMRTLAWAAMAVLLLAPESLLGASFQMSFAAATALIAVYELGTTGELGLAAAARRARPFGRAAFYFSGVALTTLTANLATAPFLLYAFDRFSTFGLVANLVAVPLTGIWVMPWALVAFALMPFGLEELALTPMGWGVDAVIAVARMTASWPHAVINTPEMPLLALVAVVAGGIWLCLWRSGWRLLGLIGIAAGALIMALSRPPDILADEGARIVGVRAADGGLMLSSAKRARFEAEVWLRRSGEPEPRPWPPDGANGDGRLTCDALGCLYRARGRLAAIIKAEDALAEDCPLADVVVSLVPVRGGCHGKAIVIDRFDLWRAGAHAVWLGPEGVRVETVRGWQGRRPWVPLREPRRPRSVAADEAD